MHPTFRSTRWWPLAAVAAMLTFFAPRAHAQIQQLEALNTEQIAALDKSRTVVIMPGGILEEHGPYLPSNTDGYVSEREAQDVAEALVAHGWRVVMFPVLPLGSGGANELAGKYPFPGTYVVRLNTLRAVYMDLADELGEAGFKWIFLLHSHGAPNHNHILDQVCDYFTQSYGGRMVHITGGFETYSSPDNPRNALSRQAQEEDASSGHAGIDETSLMLFLQPNLVSPEYRNAPAFTATFDRMIEVAKRPDWRGYFGAPRYSSAEYGAKLYRLETSAMIKQALSTLESPKAPAARRSGQRRAVDNAAIARDNAIEKRQQDWLKKNE